MKKCITNGLKFVTSILFFTTSTFYSHAQSTKNLVLALSKTDHTLSIVDPGTLKVLVKCLLAKTPMR
jgi:hypothetical protein